MEKRRNPGVVGLIKRKKGPHVSSKYKHGGTSNDQVAYLQEYEESREAWQNEEDDHQIKNEKL